ncbi:MAG: inosine/xanthosine triphosphatase [Candidatus Magasanikbacteria bacterium]|nr:inosine/xanthosine triphosphatase [Candidatus Magasanikbacteria bacterium]
MLIIVGSKNPVKIAAVREIIADYPLIAGATVEGVAVDSGVTDQPITLEATIDGAINRAKAAFKDCHYSFGIESGIMPVPHTKTGYMDVCACVIYDGNEIHLGLSSAFEYPKQVTEFILKNHLDASTAFKHAGLTDHPYIGYGSGIIGILTNSRLLRKEYTQQAIRNALIHLEHPEWY